MPPRHAAAVALSQEELLDLANQPADQAAKQLGVGRAAFRALLRRRGIMRWPYHRDHLKYGPPAGSILAQGCSGTLLPSSEAPSSNAFSCSSSSSQDLTALCPADLAVQQPAVLAAFGAAPSAMQPAAPTAAADAALVQAATSTLAPLPVPARLEALLPAQALSVEAAAPSPGSDDHEQDGPKAPTTDGHVPGGDEAAWCARVLLGLQGGAGPHAIPAPASPKLERVATRPMPALATTPMALAPASPVPPAAAPSLSPSPESIITPGPPVVGPGFEAPARAPAAAEAPIARMAAAPSTVQPVQMPAWLHQSPVLHPPPIHLDPATITTLLPVLPMLAGAGPASQAASERLLLLMLMHQQQGVLATRLMSELQASAKAAGLAM